MIRRIFMIGTGAPHIGPDAESACMSSVGSYLQFGTRGATAPGDLSWLCSHVLKLLGEEPRSFGALLSVTGAGEKDFARAETDL
jgi:hypothetical protein